MAGDFACGDEAHDCAVLVLVEGVDDHQQAAVVGMAEGHPALFLFAVFLIRNRHHQPIPEHRGCLRERDAVLTAVGGGLAGVPLFEGVGEGHSHILRRGPTLGIMLNQHPVDQLLDDLLLVQGDAGDRLEAELQILVRSALVLIEQQQVGADREGHGQPAQYVKVGWPSWYPRVQIWQTNVPQRVPS